MRKILLLFISIGILFCFSCSAFSAGNYLASGNLKFNIQDYNGAIDDYTLAIEADPNSAEAYINRGSAKFKLADYNASLQDYTSAIKLDNKLSTGYINRGNLYIELKSYNLAIQDYKNAINLSSDNTVLKDLYQLKINAEILDNKYLEAARDYDNLITIEPNNVRLYNKKKQQLLEAQSNSAIASNVAATGIYHNVMAVVVVAATVADAVNEKNKSIDAENAAIIANANAKAAEENRKKAEQQAKNTTTNKPTTTNTGGGNKSTTTTASNNTGATGTIVIQNLSSVDMYGQVGAGVWQHIPPKQSINVPVNRVGSHNVYFSGGNNNTNPAFENCNRFVYVGQGQSVSVSCNIIDNTGSSNTVANNNNGGYNNSNNTNTQVVSKPTDTHKYVAGGVYTHCMEIRHDKSDVYVKNICSETIHVSVAGVGDAQSCWGANDIEPGVERMVASGCRNANEDNSRLYACPEHYVAVDANNEHSNHYIGPFRCRSN